MITTSFRSLSGGEVWGRTGAHQERKDGPSSPLRAKAFARLVCSLSFIARGTEEDILDFLLLSVYAAPLSFSSSALFLISGGTIRTVYPACAGEPWVVLLRSPTARVYPRVCGGTNRATVSEDRSS